MIRRRTPLRFSLTTLLLLVFACCLALMWWRWETREERAVAALEALGAHVSRRELSIIKGGGKLPPEMRGWDVYIYSEFWKGADTDLRWLQDLSGASTYI